MPVATKWLDSAVGSVFSLALKGQMLERSMSCSHFPLVICRLRDGGLVMSAFVILPTFSGVNWTFSSRNCTIYLSPLKKHFRSTLTCCNASNY